MIGVLKYKWTLCAYEFSCFSWVPEELLGINSFEEKTLFCQTKHSLLPETLHFCELAKEHFFFLDKNPLKLRRTSVSEVESMSRNSDSSIELGLRSCFFHKWRSFDGETFSDFDGICSSAFKTNYYSQHLFFAVALLISPPKKAGRYKHNMFAQ